MDRSAEPIHGCSIRPFAPPLVGTTAGRWCRSLDLELKVAELA
jgi:hypothetical protein